MMTLFLCRTGQRQVRLYLHALLHRQAGIAFYRSLGANAHMCARIQFSNTNAYTHPPTHLCAEDGVHDSNVLRRHVWACKEAEHSRPPGPPDQLHTLLHPIYETECA
jgi:hypothetical protein